MGVSSQDATMLANTRHTLLAYLDQKPPAICKSPWHWHLAKEGVVASMWVLLDHRLPWISPTAERLAPCWQSEVMASDAALTEQMQEFLAMEQAKAQVPTRSYWLPYILRQMPGRRL